MEKPVLVLARPLPAAAAHILRDSYTLLEIDPSDPASLAEALSRAEAFIPNGHRIDEALLSGAPNLRIVSDISVGYDNFELTAMAARGVLGTHTPSVLDDSVADTILGLMLACARRISELDRYVKAGRWTGREGSALFGVEMSRKTLGIIGMGRIGQAVAWRCRLGFSMEILYHNRRPVPDVDATYMALPDLLAASDFVLVMTPLTPETRGMIGLSEFRQMKPTAIFINASRGPVVREAELIQALREKRIYGAGLDVYDREPVEPGNPLLQFPNVVTTPHIGSATRETRDAMAMRAAENLLAFARGEMPPDVVPELRQKAQ